MIRSTSTFVSIWLTVCIAAGAFGCSSSSHDALASGNPDGGACPVAAPKNGDACDGSAQECDYPAVTACDSSVVVVCSDGTWSLRVTGEPGSPLGCPSTRPDVGSACDQNACGPSSRSCSYGCTTLTCTAGAWQSEGASCDAGPDSGSNLDAGDARD